MTLVCGTQRSLSQMTILNQTLCVTDAVGIVELSLCGDDGTRIIPVESRIARFIPNEFQSHSHP